MGDDIILFAKMNKLALLFQNAKERNSMKQDGA
jgi:hypothetical protein